MEIRRWKVDEGQAEKEVKFGTANVMDGIGLILAGWGMEVIANANEISDG